MEIFFSNTKVHYNHYSQTSSWSSSVSSCPILAAHLVAMPQNNSGMLLGCDYLVKNSMRTRQCATLVAASMENSKDICKVVGEHSDNSPATSDSSSGIILDGKSAKGSGTTARGRRLLKVREEKRKREYDRLHNYPTWAKVLEDACKNDEELRAVLGDSIGNPELMRKRVEDRVRRKGRNFQKSKTGSVLAFKVSFRDFNPLDSYIWFELYGSPSDRDVDLLGSVIQSWYVMGRLGAFNSSNLQLANSSMQHDPLYDAEKGFKVMPSSFHDISDVEFQDNWGRVWYGLLCILNKEDFNFLAFLVTDHQMRFLIRVDLGTSDFFAIDVLLNCLTVLSSEYLGIQQVVFGGRKLGDWEEGMTSSEYGYKFFKI